MAGQTLSPPISAALFATLWSELRSRVWVAMGLVIAIGGAMVLAAPIPFWNADITGRAIVAMDIAIMTVSIAIASSYDTIRWLVGFPISSAAAIATLNGARMIAAILTATVAVLLQTSAYIEFTDRAASGKFLIGTLASVALSVVTLVPWSALAAVAIGPIGAPWLVLGVTILGSWTAGEGGAPGFVRLLLPATPLVSTLSTPAPRDWLYAVTHAGMITILTSALLRRYR